MAIVLRSSKDSALTFAEMDGNITDLDTRISAIDSAFIKGVAGTDSANVIKVVNTTVDSAYVRGKIVTDQNLKMDDSVVFGTLQVTGNLVVNGSTTTLSSQTLSVGNRNVILADSAVNAAAADSGGVILKGANANILYKVANDKWNFNKGIVAPNLSGKYLGADSDFSVNFALASTDSLSEGVANQYYTNTRVDQRINLVVDANYVQSRQANFDFLDSAEAINIFDSAYVNARVNPNLFTDSAEVSAIADSAYVQLRQDKAFSSLTGTPTTLAGYGITDGFKADGSTAMLGVLNLNSNAITNVTTIAANAVNANVNSTTANITNLDVTGTADFGGATITGLDVTDSVAITQMIDSAYVRSLADSAYIKTVASDLDSALTQQMIDSPYVQARQRLYNTSDFPDSAFVTSRPVSTFTNDTGYLTSGTVGGVVDNAYVQARQIQYNTSDFLDSTTVALVVDAGYISSRITASETLASVTARGDSTAESLLFKGGLTVTGGITTDSIANTGLGFGAVTSASDVHLSANNGAGVINANTSKITNVGNPTSNQDAATKSYVDTNVSTFRNDYIIAELNAKTTTTNTDAFMPLNNTPISEHSPTVLYDFSGTEAVRTNTAGHYSVSSTVTWYKENGQNGLKVTLQKSSGGAFSNIPGAMGSINCGDSGYGSVTIGSELQLSANDLIRVNVDQISVASPNTNNETDNYISSPGITGEGAHPGYSILKVMKLG